MANDMMFPKVVSSIESTADSLIVQEVFESYIQALKAIRDQGFKHDKRYSIKEDKMTFYRKGRNYKILTSKYNRYEGTRWVVRTW